nr:helix-turn-helix transcriptional regulator [uncultured Schaedlerella sp.]
MEVLSFGEQVKIILSRKGMTIKELAELIEDTTGKKMSRQNLTQRLGRDNFQEKDMRMIAKILGCPFQLSIFPVENEAGEKTEPMEELLLKYVKHPKVQPKKKKETQDDGFYQQVLVFDQDTPETAAEEPDRKEEAAVPQDADRMPSAGEMMEMTEGKEEAAPVGIRDASMEDAYADESGETSDYDDGEDLLELDILDPEDSEDLDEADLLYGGFKTKRIDRKAILAAAEKAEKEKWDAVTGTADRAEEDSSAEEHKSGDGMETGNSPGMYGGEEEQKPSAGTGARYDMEEQKPDAGPEMRYDREEQRQDLGTPKETAAAEERDMTIGELYMIHKELDELEESIHPNVNTGMASSAQAVPAVPAVPEPVPAVRQVEEEEDPEPEDFEPVIRYEDAEENLELGEMNPYTGREYQTNSVRMHPTRIGYVQVYDRFQHGWTDMTEWAFLGYQERKKTLLGRDYEPPIYLD